MTNKEKSIHNLHQARTAHIRWVNAIKLLISGIDVSADSIAISPTDSPFGQWFYDEAMLFSLGTSRMVLEEMEMILLALHDKYMKIYPIYFGNKKKGLLGGLIGSKTKASEHEIELSQHFYEEIITLSDKLKHKLRIFESQLVSLNDDKFSFMDTIYEEVSLPAKETADIAPQNEEAYYYGTRGR